MGLNRSASGSGAVSSVNTRTGAVTGLAEAVDLAAEATTARSAEGSNAMAIASEATTARAAEVTKAMGLTPTAVKTADYSAAAGDFVPVDTTSNAVTVTLPTAPADKTRVALKHVIQGGTNTVTYACGGSDVLNKTGGATTGTLTLLSQAAVLQYKASGAIWYIQSADVPLAQLDLRYGRIPNVVSLAQTADYTQAGVQTTFTQLGTINPSITLVSGTGMRVMTSGAMSMSSNDPLDEMRLSIDNGASFVQLGRLTGNTSGMNPSCVEVVSGLSLGAHTVKFEYKKSAGGTLFLRASTQPQIEHFRITLEELPT